MGKTLNIFIVELDFQSLMCKALGRLVNAEKIKNLLFSFNPETFHLSCGILSVYKIICKGFFKLNPLHSDIPYSLVSSSSPFLVSHFPTTSFRC